MPAPSLQPSLAVAGELLDALVNNDGVTRAGGTTASNRRYTAADITAQVFLAPASAQGNDKDRLTAAGLGNSRNAMNRRRGAGA